jgi:B12-binding domain/radical SAM domain protein of rhizo-twelve system
MKFALVNPSWDFAGSTYFGCHEPHYPLELLFAFDHLQSAGHEPLLLDAHIEGLSLEEAHSRVDAFKPDVLVMTTAPTYLFWRCPQPELRVPKQWFAALGNGALKVAIGPHSSATPQATLRKLNVDVAMRGEPDQNLALLATTEWSKIDGCCWRDENGFHLSPTLGVTRMHETSALKFDNFPVEQHNHRHHVFEGSGRGAELEFARGCPWSCNFCNKTLFRDKFRERPVATLIEEVDRLIARGVDYVYFIDEIFGVGKNVRRLLEAIAERPIKIGFQSRIDLWNEETLDLLGRAHCISFECGIESITEAGRDELNKNCRMSTARLSELLIYARKRIPWVQANLILTEHDERGEIRKWQDHLKAHSVWVSDPVPMFPYPGTPQYVHMFGAPDDNAWERAHRYYTQAFGDKGYSDIQEERPVSIEELECTF